MKSKKNMLALAAMLGVAGVGGTLAYFNQELSAANKFDTGVYDTELVEKFTPKDNWEPGVKVNKDVWVENTGTYPVVVRVLLEESWVRKGEETPFYFASSKENKLDPSAESTANNKIESVFQNTATDGAYGADKDDSVVHKELHLGKDWFYNATDGYYYYNKVLSASDEGVYDSTSFLLDSVTLDENADMGAYGEKKFYAITENKPASDSADWIEFTADSESVYLSMDQMNALVKEETGKEITFVKAVTAQKAGLEGYSKADYTLTVTAQTVQATSKAVEDAFAADGQTLAELIDQLEGENKGTFADWTKNIKDADEMETAEETTEFPAESTSAAAN